MAVRAFVRSFTSLPQIVTLMKKLRLLPLFLVTFIQINAVFPQENSTDDQIDVLSPFVVVSTASEGYREEQSSTGTIVAMDIKDIPMDMTIIGSNLLQDFGLFNLDELDQIIPSLTNDLSPGSSGGGGATRYILRGFRSVPLRNGAAPGGRVFDGTGVDRIEVLKGPNSVL